MSVVDLVVLVEKETTVEEVRKAFAERRQRARCRGSWAVPMSRWSRSTFKGDDRSAIVDMDNILVMEKNLIKVLAWYDNEWGYSCRVRDLILKIAGGLKWPKNSSRTFPSRASWFLCATISTCR